MATDLHIRPVERQDVPALKAIAEATELFPASMLDDMIAGYFDRSKADLWFTAVRDGVPLCLGFCEPERMTEGTWNLLALGVRPEHQGTGIGTAMLRYLEERLAARGERVLLIETMGTEQFERTRSFYRNNGYTEEARIREFYAAGADKVVFWKHL
ncbi:MAG: GNAT family N-acetyltransferase [Myxococcota bacterium]